MDTNGKLIPTLGCGNGGDVTEPDLMRKAKLLEASDHINNALRAIKLYDKFSALPATPVTQAPPQVIKQPK